MDIRPEFGVFHATPKTCAGEILRALKTRMVNEYNGLLARLSQRIFYSDATEEAFERTGARERAKGCGTVFLLSSCLWQ